MLVYLRTVRSKLTPPAGANPLLLVFGWLLMGLLFIAAVGFGLLFMLVGWILLLPLLWRRRREIKQFWQFNRAVKKAAQTTQQSTSTNSEKNNHHGGRIFEGEYRDTSER